MKARNRVIVGRRARGGHAARQAYGLAIWRFEHEALDYVLKPVKRERLQRTIERVQRGLAEARSDDGALLAALRKLLPALATAEHLIRTPIAELGAQLDPTQFVQVHRSTIVNLACVSGARRDEASRLFLRIPGHAHELPVSRAYVHLFKAM